MANNQSRSRSLQTAKAVLQENYYTAEEATQIIRETFPGMEFNRRQINRALDNKVIHSELIGRLRYIPQAELDEYIAALQPTESNPNKLRHRRNWRSQTASRTPKA